MSRSILTIALVVIFVTNISCFNFDLNTPVYKKMNKNVLFGYSIAQHSVKSSRTSL